MEWLGHKDPKSTQHNARVNPTRLASAYTHADRTSHLVEVLVDTKVKATGEVPLYYVLGDHGLCSNPAWATCDYRMACIKCPFFVPTEPARLIRSRQTVKHFLEMVELNDHELAAVQDDEQKLAANIQRTQHLAPPHMLRRRAKGAAEPGVPLTALAPATLPPPRPRAADGLTVLFRVIPLLCHKAGVDPRDAEGAYKAHCGRSARISMLHAWGLELEDLAAYAIHTNTQTIKKYASSESHPPASSGRAGRHAFDFNRGTLRP